MSGKDVSFKRKTENIAHEIEDANLELKGCKLKIQSN
jgi:hypothetical protein